MVFNALYIIFFLGSLVVFLKLLFASEYHKFFKQGRILEIRIGYCLVAIICSYLTSSAIMKFLEVITNLIVRKSA